MSKTRRDVLRYIDATIEYERGHSKITPPGGFECGLDRAEADLIYRTVRRTLTALGLSTEPELKPQSDYMEKRLVDAYVRRDLDPTPLRM